jgi:predicted house-cleaning NTP pyrophosphatase (Maf/HAM1 superfamily)
MAKRRGGKKRKYKNRKRVSAGKRAYKKSGLYKYNMRRKKRRGGKRRKGRKGRKYKGRRSGKKSRSYVRKAKAAGVNVMSASKVQNAYRRIIDRGGSEEHARKVVARLERMRRHQIHAGVVAHEAKVKADAERKKAASFADLFRKIGAEEARRASL